MICDVCGKDITYPTPTDQKGWVILGPSGVLPLSFRIDELKGKSPEVHAYNKRMAGPYELNRDYYVCWECILRSVGIPEPKTNME